MQITKKLVHEIENLKQDMLMDMTSAGSKLSFALFAHSKVNRNFSYMYIHIYYSSLHFIYIYIYNRGNTNSLLGFQLTSIVIVIGKNIQLLEEKARNLLSGHLNINSDSLMKTMLSEKQLKKAKIDFASSNPGYEITADVTNAYLPG